MHNIKLVSVHGGHSGSYCGHATDSLEAVIQRYIELGFEWVCLTEHMPADVASLVAPEDRATGLSVQQTQDRFDRYFEEARRLASNYSNQIEILVGFETDAYTGYEEAVANLVLRHQPDLIVGSVHHVHDVLFDDTPNEYHRAVEKSGGIESLYCNYFDKQLALIERFQPAIVGHFDLIRIHDPDYRQRWQNSEILDRAIRNLDRIKDLELILDLNVRSFAKGASEPYLSAPFMNYAIDQDILISPGDDSHGIESVGANIARGADLLLASGGNIDWPKPAVGRHLG